MGTRADFYIGKGPEAEYLGSIAWDGYPGGLDVLILNAMSEKVFRQEVSRLLAGRDDGTIPEEHGWPWPWNDSGTSDYAYAFFDNKVWYSGGYPVAKWVPSDLSEPGEEEEEAFYAGLKPCVFPDMSAIKKVTMGRRSGLIVVTNGLPL